MTIRFSCGHERLGPIHANVDEPCPACLGVQMFPLDAHPGQAPAVLPDFARFVTNDQVCPMDPAVEAAARTLGILIECWMTRTHTDSRLRSVFDYRCAVMRDGSGDVYVAFVGGLGRSAGHRQLDPRRVLAIVEVAVNNVLRLNTRGEGR